MYRHPSVNHETEIKVLKLSGLIPKVFFLQNKLAEYFSLPISIKSELFFPDVSTFIVRTKRFVGKGFMRQSRLRLV